MWKKLTPGLNVAECCDLNNPPWFLKQLPFPTTDDIEMRLCRSAADYEDTPVEIIELYIQ
jgi:hypothetical protein